MDKVTGDDVRPVAQWGVRPAVPVVGAVLTLFCVVWSLLVDTSEDRVAAVTAAVVLGLATLAALPLRRRLTADRTGFVVRSVAGVRPYGWHQVVTISAPSRKRRGLSSISVEIDLDDESLIVLSRFELGADPDEVVGRLQELRAVAD